MRNPSAGAAEAQAIEAEATRAAQAGRPDEALRLWTRLLEVAPDHARALDILGQAAFRRGDLERARSLLQRLVAVDGSDPQQWVNLAVACQGLKDDEGEERAITQALTADPRDLLALLLRGNLLERKGRSHDAARAYGAAAAVAPPMERLHPDLRPSVSHALAFKRKYDDECSAFLAQYLEPHFNACAGEDLGRFRDSVDIMVGRKRRFDSQSVVYHYPRLVPIEFFDRQAFPWLEAVEAATEAVRNEFLEVLRADAGFTPYVEYAPDVPLNQWAELNHSPRWSAFHLLKMGARVEGNASKCPRTMAMLAGVPQPLQAGRTPAAMFSLLKPRTRIPPHTGVTNVRVVAHLPLIVPEGCGFRVGNETRKWVPGTAWVFDDTIDHEAWNDSAELRAILIFDVWHPHLTAAERTMISAMAEGLNAFAGSGGFEL